MTDGGYYFDEDAVDLGIGDSAVQAMARRQFGFSLAVALAMLAAAGLTMIGERHASPSIDTAARHIILRADAPNLLVAQPASMLAKRG